MNREILGFASESSHSGQSDKADIPLDFALTPSIDAVSESRLS